MTIETILNYVMTSPYNANRQVLKSLLESLVSDANKDDLEGAELTVTENGEYTAPTGKAYTKVTVTVGSTEENSGNGGNTNPLNPNTGGGAETDPDPNPSSGS